MGCQSHKIGLGLEMSRTIFHGLGLEVSGLVNIPGKLVEIRSIDSLNMAALMTLSINTM